MWSYIVLLAVAILVSLLAGHALGIYHAKRRAIAASSRQRGRDDSGS
jgi:uncharacterized protein YneF (UPF0154 family)